MSKKRISILTITIAIFASLFFSRTNLSALDDASSLQCSGGTVFVGDSEGSVRDKCGEPQKVTQEDADSPIVWFYNFGPSEFVCYVSFTNGVAERIQMGGYGD
ncbi:MAG: DUF2845 domain-containing protein [Deltaproteobacteria bacterium]|jgi:hypothetical protein|nr:DUF2845 domain-containing protein [Deltaproteobacteria bacterium]